MSVSPFIFVDAVSFSKKDLFKQGASEKDYVPFLVNKALSYHMDSIFYANEMNGMAHLPVKYQFGFYLNTLRAKRRFAKWTKVGSRDDIKAVAKYFGYNEIKAEQVIDLLSTEQLNMIKAKVKTVEEHGGKIRSLSGGQT